MITSFDYACRRKDEMAHIHFFFLDDEVGFEEIVMNNFEWAQIRSRIDKIGDVTNYNGFHIYAIDDGIGGIALRFVYWRDEEFTFTIPFQVRILEF